MATTYYVATPGNGGNNGNAGTSIGSPFATWEKLKDVMVAGDTAYIRGGTYTVAKSAATSVRCDLRGIAGTSGSHITISAYPGETPILDLSDVLLTVTDGYGLYTNGNYIDYIGLRVTGLAQNSGGPNPGEPLWGWINENATGITVTRCVVDNIGGQGFFESATNGTYYLNCDVYYCSDPYSGSPYGGSNGFSATGNGNTATNITYEGCRAWWISDDGWDFFGIDGYVTIKNCWSFWNGYIPGTFTLAGDGCGYKLGPTETNQSANLKRVLTNNLAFENRNTGFDQNNANCKMNIFNNTAYANVSGSGFSFGYNLGTPISSSNNASLNNNSTFAGTNIQGNNNSWNGSVTITTGDFITVSSAGVTGSRQADGSLPNLNFLKLTAGSDLINAGINVGLPYYGSAPDIGAYEYNPSVSGVFSFNGLKSLNGISKIIFS